MFHLSVRKLSFNLWVIAGIVLLAVVLGILNNFRVYEEQRVAWSTTDDTAQAAEGEETEDTDAEGADADEEAGQ